MPTAPAKPILYIIVNNHFDLTWRRCWQQPFTYQGKTYVSYTDLQAYYMLDNLDLARRDAGYKFEAESVQIVRKFIERCPETLPILQELARTGRFAITGGGEAIVDANMIHGESLVRNYVDGLLWVEQVFGQTTHLAVRNDAFGNSAQLPQILRGCEINWATGMSYSPAQGRYWRGLDGSAILVRSLPVVAWGGGVLKYPPCPTCQGNKELEGKPCPGCGGRGIETVLLAGLPGPVDEQVLAEFGAGLVWVTPEELLPNPALLDWAEAMRQDYEVRFALEEEALPHLQPWLKGADHPAEGDLHPGLELNPNNSGCLVTRIKTKQAVRRQEHALLGVEALSVMAALKGHPYPADDLRLIRQDQYFTMFHDAITATHVDAAYRELESFWQKIDQDTTRCREVALAALLRPGQNGEFSVINPTAQTVTAVCTAPLAVPGPVGLYDENGRAAAILGKRLSGEGQAEVTFLVENLPPFAARVYRAGPPAADQTPEIVSGKDEIPGRAVIENQRYRVQADAGGLLAILDKTIGREILAADGVRPGELILEHDEGSPWATLYPDQARTSLAPFTRLSTIEKGPGWQRLVFQIEAPREMGLSGKCLRARLAVTLVEGLERVDFTAHVYWDAFNYRLRVAMPVPCSPKVEARHVYEIPYGMLARQPYPPEFRWAGPNGDWPAIHWAGVEQPGLSVALFNQGNPSYRMEAGAARSEVILLSLLRSPAIPTYLHEPEYYSMTEWDGMRDSGEHDFAFAVAAYDRPFAESSVVLDGEVYHTTLISRPGIAEMPTMPQVEAGIARLSAVKWAEAGDGLVLRLVEFRGQGGEVVIKLPPQVQAAEKVNLLERRPRPLPVAGGITRLNLNPWEIATVWLGLKKG